MSLGRVNANKTGAQTTKKHQQKTQMPNPKWRQKTHRKKVEMV